MKCSSPTIEMNIACEGWPQADILRKLVEKSVSSAVKVAKLEIPAKAELSLMFGDDEAIADLNHQFRDITKPTNVLSFPGSNILAGEPSGKMLGDIAFALQTIRKEADFEGKTFEHHLSHLVIHGFLHLFGYDHFEDNKAGTMETLEKEALAGLGIANPYEDCEPDPVQHEE